MLHIVIYENAKKYFCVCACAFGINWPTEACTQLISNKKQANVNHLIVFYVNELVCKTFSDIFIHKNSEN